jgi:hypothetical protein
MGDENCLLVETERLQSLTALDGESKRKMMEFNLQMAESP